MTTWVAFGRAFGEDVVVPEGQCPSGDGEREREDTVGNDASELGCEGRGASCDDLKPGVVGFAEPGFVESECGVQCSLFVASIYYI